ncbi:hypothetical protein [Nesterenkonia rhizosphaerae]|uniref:hypothetical protein n=1 Tax=Nesterenkonia rhizosphaerae TaxID=1348272 RepID=UPI0031E6F19E
MSLAMSAAFLVTDRVVEAAVVLLAGTQLLVLGAVWFAYRASTRVTTLKRQTGGLKRELEGLRKEVSDLRRKEEGWHELTRKRLRQKHNSLERMLQKNRELHEVTRKRIREKQSAMYKYIAGRTEKLERLHQQSLQQAAPTYQNPAVKKTKQDQPALRNALFALLEKNN